MNQGSLDNVRWFPVMNVESLEKAAREFCITTFWFRNGQGFVSEFTLFDGKFRRVVTNG